MKHLRKVTAYRYDRACHRKLTFKFVFLLIRIKKFSRQIFINKYFFDKQKSYLIVIIKMVYIAFPSNHTEEEQMLQAKYQKLKKKVIKWRCQNNSHKLKTFLFQKI